MITVLVNESQVEIDEKASIHQLLQKLNTPVNGIAIAINDRIISNSKWDTTNLNPNDKVLIIKATQGG